MSLWLIPATRANLEKSIEASIDLELAKQYLSNDFISNLQKYSNNQKGIYCWGLSKNSTKLFDDMRPGDEVLITEKGTGKFTYYAEIIDKTINPDLALKLWPFIGKAPWEYIYFLTNIKKIDKDKKEIVKDFGYSEHFAVSGSIKVRDEIYSSYGKVADQFKLGISKYSFPAAPTTNSKVPTSSSKGDTAIETAQIHVTEKETFFQAGDIVLTKGSSNKSNQIIFFQNISSKFTNTPHTKFSHVSLGVSNGVFIEATVAESHDVRFLHFDELFSKANAYKVYRNNTLSTEHKNDIIKWSRRYVQQDYRPIKNTLWEIAKEKLFFYATFKGFFSHYTVEEKYNQSFCSELVIKILRNTKSINIFPEKNAAKLAPAHLQNYLDESGDWEDITSNYKELLDDKKQYEEKKSKAIDYLKTISHDQLEKDAISECQEWRTNYSAPAKVPLWEQVKIQTRLNNDRLGSYSAEKVYRDFFNQGVKNA